MRFHRLDLLKYGKFSDQHVDFPAAKRDFHLVVGPNEAGKSTLRSAILDLLFGIPTRSPLGFLHPLSELCLGASIGNKAGSLEFRRVKAQKQTLRSPLDAVLADTALVPFLGSADRNFFDQMFGLDHTRLVEGGNNILNAANDVGQVLFQSAAGVANLGKIRDALMAEADKLWSPRKAADRAYYAAADQLEKATAALKEASVRTKAWTDANSKVEALQEALAGERDTHQQLQGRRSRLERVRRLGPFLRALRESQTQLAQLGHVVDLPMDAATTLATAERELATARQLLDLRNGEVSKASEDFANIRVDEAVLGLAADIGKLEELRLQYSAYEHDIQSRKKEIEALWRDVSNECRQLGWESESEDSLAQRLPTLLARRALDKMARDSGGLSQGLKDAEKNENAKQLDIKLLSDQLTELQTGEVKPALRTALAGARALGETESAMQKQRGALSKANAALEGAFRSLGPWRKPMAELAAIQPPGQPTISRFTRERQDLVAERKVVLTRLEEQKATVARVELEISQFKELHQPTTHEAVVQVRHERDVSWSAIKAGAIGLQAGAPAFEGAMLRADQTADTRLDSVEDATALQSLQHQFEREKQGLSAVEIQSSRVEAAIRQLDAKWTAAAAGAGLDGMQLEEIADWLAKREKALAAASVEQEAQAGLDLVVGNVAEARRKLANALRESALPVAELDGLSELCVQAEAFIQANDSAKVRHETLSAQLRAAQALEGTLKQATVDARAAADRWKTDWSTALAVAGLPATSDIVTAEGALELIGLIEEKLTKIRQIRVERIDAMNADLNRFAVEAQQLGHAIAAELEDRTPAQIAQELARRLSQARAANTEATRLKEALRKARAQVVGATESQEKAIASLKPLMERAGVDSNALLDQAIARSDQQRLLNAKAVEAKAHLLDGGDGLAEAQIEAEVDAADFPQLATELAQINDAIATSVERQTTHSADLATASKALSDIGGSDAAAQAEARRQEALARMSDVAERYIKVFTAGRLLRWSIDRYREEKQGPLLARAGAIFSKLTLGSFQRLVVDFEREPMALEGQRSDGGLVGISGMSDGTRDQLYLALRLAALELHLDQATPLPFIADDLFINYDPGRSKAGLEALADLSERTQVIFLSHHDHLISTVQGVFGEKVNVVVL